MYTRVTHEGGATGACMCTHVVHVQTVHSRCPYSCSAPLVCMNTRAHAKELCAT